MRAYLSALVLFFSTFASAATLNNIVVFGDSLSDDGKFYEINQRQYPVSPPYFAGRFSNGPVWVELLGKSYFGAKSKLRLENYAFGGANVLDDSDDGLFNLMSQVNTYLLVHHGQAKPNDLYIIWIGSNDYLGAPDNIQETNNKVNELIVNNLEKLVSKGAQHFLIMNLPNLGRVPAGREFSAQMSALALGHNALLHENIEKLKIKYPSVQWLEFNIESALDEMLTNPGPNGFTNVTDNCLSSASEENFRTQSALKIVTTVRINNDQIDCSGYLFMDGLHPTAHAHEILAERIRTLLSASYIYFKTGWWG